MLWYDCDTAKLPEALAERFVRLDEDSEARAFLARAEARRPGWVKTIALRLLERLVSDYDAYGMLGMYDMHLLSTRQFRALLPDVPDGARLLDVGAGGGGVTERAAPLFGEVVATETSGPLRKRLSARGFRVVEHDLGRAPWPGPERFGVVSVLNVLDRTARPRSLLSHAVDTLAGGGRLLLSVPLPLRPHAYAGARVVDPEEPLPRLDGGWEACVGELVSAVIEPAGLRVERLTRVPYLSEGDASRPLYVLDAAVLVCVRA